MLCMIINGAYQYRSVKARSSECKDQAQASGSSTTLTKVQSFTLIHLQSLTPPTGERREDSDRAERQTLIDRFERCHRNQAPTPMPGPSIPSAECHQPCGTSTDSPAVKLTWQAPGSANALISWALNRSRVCGGTISSS